MTGSRWLVATGIVGAIALAGYSGAQAGLSKKVQKTFKGKILISEKQLDLEADEASDAKTIAYCKKNALKQIKGAENADGVQAWSFHYTAFLSKAPRSNWVSFDFYTDDREKRYVANKKMMGIDPQLTTLQGQLNITEDDGLNSGRRYVVKLTTEVKGKEVVLATTKIATK